MARALVWMSRTGTGDWRPVGVFLATPRRLDARALPGDVTRTQRFQTILADAQRPQREPYNPARGTWEDWIGWALDQLSNGHTTMMVEVEPERSADALYRREVLGADPSVGSPEFQATTDIPPLSGAKAAKVRANMPVARA